MWTTAPALIERSLTFYRDTLGLAAFPGSHLADRVYGA